MKLSRNNRITINLVILSISVFVWVLLLINPGHIMTIEHCHVSASGPSAASLEMLMQMNPVSSQLLGWGLMVLAMMFPKLIIPVGFIWLHSFRRNRFLCSLLFVIGYIITWMVAGLFMVAVIMSLNLLMPMSYIPAAAIFVIGVVWQFCPFKQRFLNLGHDHYVLPAFGSAAFRGSFFFGLKHGVWCVGSGWALMLFPMLLPRGHNLAMIIFTVLMISEHLEHPQVPRWRIDLRGRWFRYIAAQIQIKMERKFKTIWVK